MNPKKRIAVVTGTRAEFGHLQSILDQIKKTPELDLSLVVTGAHLSKAFGMTVHEIEQGGYEIAARVEILSDDDSPKGVCKSVAKAVDGFAEVFSHIRPELVLLLGDRYEILAAAEVCLIMNIPLAHIGGGDVTEGAIDEGMRHSLTKMSHLHFVTNDESAKRVVQMGEDPQSVYNVGAPSLDFIKQMKLLEADELLKEINFPKFKKNLLVTFHPVTLEPGQAESQIAELFSALEGFGPDVGIIFTKSNADTDGMRLNQILEVFADSHKNVKAYDSLGLLKYLSCLKYVDVVVGNSSSGLIEAPSFKVATVNVGDRQKGRPRATSVINCEPNSRSIKDAIDKALMLDCTAAINPYYQGGAAEKIVKVIAETKDFTKLLKKKFHAIKY